MPAPGFEGIILILDSSVEMMDMAVGDPEIPFLIFLMLHTQPVKSI